MINHIFSSALRGSFFSSSKRFMTLNIFQFCGNVSGHAKPNSPLLTRRGAPGARARVRQSDILEVVVIER